jgi:hypothetical protein
MTLRFVLAPVALAGALLFATSPVLRADDDCQKRTINADHRLHEAIQKHGPDSPDAQHWRQELAEARSYCYQHDHRWWDEDNHKWHTDRDWDDHDHDHDHDYNH